MTNSRPEECEDCSRKATIHLTQIVGNQVLKLDLCGECPKAKQFQDSSGFALLDKISGLKQELKRGTQASDGRCCPHCGFPEADLWRTGRLGCPTCYAAFGDPLIQRLAALHRGIRHVGKEPLRLPLAVLAERAGILERDLKEAVAAEDFEQAARLRDRIAQLRAGLRRREPGPTGDGGA